MRARALLPLLLLLPLGCALATEPASDDGRALPADLAARIDFRADAAEYRRGDTATVVLRNRTAEPLGYNLCLSARERRTSGGWQRQESLRICALVLHTLAPGAETVLREPITSEWEPGEYRMVTTVELMRSGARGEVFTPPFTVRR